MRLAGRASLTVMACLLLALAPAAMAGVGKLKPASGFKKVDLRPYDSITIVDLTDGVEEQLPDEAENASYHREVVAAGAQFADVLSTKIGRSQGFRSVTRAPAATSGLVLAGRMTRYKVSNVAARYIGFGAGSKLGAVIELKDAASGKLLGTIDVDLGSEAIPGAINAIQTVGRFMDGGAIRVADELLIAKRIKHREETGRQGRLREKYAN